MRTWGLMQRRLDSSTRGIMVQILIRVIWHSTVEEVRAPMDAIFDDKSTNSELFNSSSLIYIHCCDFSHTFTFSKTQWYFRPLQFLGFSIRKTNEHPTCQSRFAPEIRWMEVSCSRQCAVKCNIRGLCLGIYIFCSLFHFWAQKIVKIIYDLYNFSARTCSWHKA